MEIKRGKRKVGKPALSSVVELDSHPSWNNFKSVEHKFFIAGLCNSIKYTMTYFMPQIHNVPKVTQDYRMIEVRREFLRSFGPALPQAGSAGAAA